MSSPLLTVLNYSGGQQSSALLWMIICGDIPRPDNFVVLNADPGMENSETYTYNELMGRECEAAGIDAWTAEGPNLLQDLLTLKSSGKKRIDNPPYWTLNPDGSHGRLMQGCTHHYKIAPMDRAIRQLLQERHGISAQSKRLGEKIVHKWIGFSMDEVHRMKPSQQKYVQFVYPLIDMGISKQGVLEYFERNALPVPPRSVCNACFANGLDTFREMRSNRPADFEQACQVDDAVRDLTQIGIKNPVFVSRTMVPLRQLPVIQEEADAEGFSCDSGYCFT